MKFINFTQHTLTPEQMEAAKTMGATEIINISNPPRFNDDGVNSYKVVNEIAEEIAKIIGDDEVAVVHFPISSPYVMALFWNKYGSLKTRLVKGKVDPNWEIVVRRAVFVFSHTDRVMVEEPQPDGSVVKKSIFKFKKFMMI
jgi:hypothetical protein